MDNLAVWVIGWGDNETLANRLRGWGVPHVFTHCNRYRGEAENYNHCFRESEAAGFRFILITDSDVEFRHQKTIPEMHKSISEHDDWGSIRPWRQGENPIPYAPIEEKYLDDGTAVMWRLNTGVYCDEEFLFTGWIDYDLGNELERHGYKNMNDRRYPVLHDMSGSNRHNKSYILNAIKKANKLRLDYKWYLCGRDRWTTTEAFNSTLPESKRIPSINELAYYTNEQQWDFAESISPEHMNIWVKDGRKNPNLEWENPVIVGYSTREEFEKRHGYS